MRIISGLYRGRQLHVAKDAKLRPTASAIRETIFNICQNEIEGACFLDLCAGTGAVGLEALSRGAKSAIFVEVDRAHAKIIKKNIDSLGVQRKTRLYVADCLEAIKKMSKQGMQFEMIFADPPYGSAEHSLSDEILLALDATSLLKKGGTLFLEDKKIASNLDLPLKQLQLKKHRLVGPVCLRQYSI